MVRHTLLPLAIVLAATSCETSPSRLAAARPDVSIPSTTANAPAPAGVATKATVARFEHQGAPIHPLGILALVGQDQRDRVDLTSCGDDGGEVSKAGATISYRYPDDLAQGLMRPPFVEYEVLASHGDRFAVRYLYNGGGTGYFSGIAAVEAREGELALRKWVHGGDRCNGGLAEAEGKGASVVYAAQITPVDLVGLVDEARDDALDEGLESSAASCVATVRFRFDLQRERETLTAIVFGDALEDRQGWTDRFAKQACFNRVFEPHANKRLTKAQLDELVDGYREACGAP